MTREAPVSPVHDRAYVPEIIYEDNHVIAVHKPAGMLTQGDASGAASLLESVRRFLKQRDAKPGNVYLGMVQRLDRPVSGVLVFAKTSKAAGRISQQIRDRRVLKYYVAVTPSAGTATTAGGGDGEPRWIELRDRLLRVGSRTVVCGARRRGSRSGVLQIATVFGNRAYGVHLVRLITGRKHQIRAQLSARHTAICGDRKYGSEIPLEPGRILLHSCLVRFAHPTTQTELEISCPPSPEFWSFFDGAEQEIIRARLCVLLSGNGAIGR